MLDYETKEFISYLFVKELDIDKLDESVSIDYYRLLIQFANNYAENCNDNNIYKILNYYSNKLVILIENSKIDNK